MARRLPAFGGWLSVPLAPGPELEGPGSSQSRPWGARRAGAGPRRALGPSRGVAGGDGPRRWGARTPGWLLGNGFQAAQGGEGVGVCGERERQMSGAPAGLQAPPRAHSCPHPAPPLRCCWGKRWAWAHRQGPPGAGTAQGPRAPGPRYLALGSSQSLTRKAAWGQKGEEGGQRRGGAGRGQTDARLGGYRGGAGGWPSFQHALPGLGLLPATRGHRQCCHDQPWGRGGGSRAELLRHASPGPRATVKLLPSHFANRGLYVEILSPSQEPRPDYPEECGAGQGPGGGRRRAWKLPRDPGSQAGLQRPPFGLQASASGPGSDSPVPSPG